jgi:3-hydroxyacyl-CoA dehydrogenase
MAEEIRRLLTNVVAARASNIDLVAVRGLGFARWRGGPMFASQLR